jgi:hypothetical protein
MRSLLLPALRTTQMAKTTTEAMGQLAPPFPCEPSIDQRPSDAYRGGRWS